MPNPSGRRAEIIEARPIVPVTSETLLAGRYRRSLGMSLLVLAGLWSAFSFLAFFGKDATISGGIALEVLGLLLGWAPAYFLRRSGNRALADALRVERLIGLARAMRWVSPDEVARELGMNEPAAVELLERAIARGQLDLVWMADEKRYLLRSELPRLELVAPMKCAACDAPQPARQLLPGEKLACSYCGAPISGAA